jgi:hypothetical protein
MPTLVSYVCDPRPRDLILLLRSTVHRFLRRVQARNLCRPCCQLPSSSSTCRRHCASSSRLLEASGVTATGLCALRPPRPRASCVRRAAVCDCPTIPGAGQLQLLARCCCPHAATVRGMIPPRSGSRQRRTCAHSAFRTPKLQRFRWNSPQRMITPAWLAPLGSDSSPLQAA